MVKVNRKFGATGATSNPIIISDLIKTGRFDKHLTELMEKGSSDEEVAWQMTDFFVRQAQEVFAEVNAVDQGQQRLRQLRARSAAWKIASCKLSVARKGGASTSSWAKSGRPAIPTA